jgi:hypothetical protein
VTAGSALHLMIRHALAGFRRGVAHFEMSDAGQNANRQHIKIG